MSQWTNVPLEVREMLSRTPGMTSRVTQTWEMLRRRSPADPEREIKHKAADMLAHEFVHQVLRDGQWRVEENPHEIAYRVDAYCLTYERLLALVMEVYNAGHKAGVLRRPMELKPLGQITDLPAR